MDGQRAGHSLTLERAGTYLAPPSSVKPKAMSAKSDPRAERLPRVTPAGTEYFYRRALSARELLPAVGVAVGAGLVAFYLARLFFQRTPLRPELRRGRRDVAARVDD